MLNEDPARRAAVAGPRNDIAADRAYIAGAQFGWNCGAEGAHEMFEAAIRGRQADISAAASSPTGTERLNAEQVVKDWEPRISEMVADLTAPPPKSTRVEGGTEGLISENHGIKSSALYQRFARMWSTHEGTARRYSLYDRYLAVRTAVHAIDHLANREGGLAFDVGANAQSILRDGIYNALDPRATGREWRNIRHTYNNERDGPHPPHEAEEDRRCVNCGAVQPEPFTHCGTKNHGPEFIATSEHFATTPAADGAESFVLTTQEIQDLIQGHKAAAMQLAQAGKDYDYHLQRLELLRSMLAITKGDHMGGTGITEELTRL